MGFVPQEALSDLRDLYPQSFQEIMAAVLTVLVWLFAIVVYLMTGDLPEWLLGFVTFTLGLWVKRPSG